MTIEMYIDDLFIDHVEMSFEVCKTFEEREQKVEAEKMFLINKHLQKLITINQYLKIEEQVEPEFWLIAESKANEIIRRDRFDKLLDDENYTPGLYKVM